MSKMKRPFEHAKRRSDFVKEESRAEGVIEDSPSTAGDNASGEVCGILSVLTGMTENDQTLVVTKLIESMGKKSVKKIAVVACGLLYGRFDRVDAWFVAYFENNPNTQPKRAARLAQQIFRMDKAFLSLLTAKARLVKDRVRKRLIRSR